MRVTGVITQGAKRIGSPEYIKSYKIAYSNDGKTWAMYKAKGTSEDKVRLENTPWTEDPAHDSWARRRHLCGNVSVALLLC